jgi:hypothetical protein
MECVIAEGKEKFSSAVDTASKEAAEIVQKSAQSVIAEGKVMLANAVEELSREGRIRLRDAVAEVVAEGRGQMRTLGTSIPVGDLTVLPRSLDFDAPLMLGICMRRRVSKFCAS